MLRLAKVLKKIQEASYILDIWLALGFWKINKASYISNWKLAWFVLKKIPYKSLIQLMTFITLKKIYNHWSCILNIRLTLPLFKNKITCESPIYLASCLKIK